MKLIINADDFGYTRGNTEGILEGYRKGIVRSTTALCNMPWLEYGRDLAKDCPGLGIGVHLTLTLGRSLTGVKSFTDAQGNFLSKKDIGSAVLDMEEVYDEWKAQIERYIQVFGHRPTHLDSHHHVHILNENNKKVAMRLGEEYGLFVRCCGPYEFVSGFYGPSATEEHLLEILEKHKGNNIEIMVHPGFCDLELYRISSYNTHRVQELSILCSRKVLEYVEKNQIQLTHYEPVEKG